VRCHACGDEIALGPAERVGFRDECPRCSADLHTCCNCAHCDPTAYNECRESSAERVLEKERANRCDYFTPGRGTAEEAASARAGALADLEKLFRK
jgi:phage terminase large subunit GpA-like protein